MDEDGVTMFPILCPTDWATIEERLLRGSNAFIHPTMMYRKAAVLEVGAYQDEYPTDDYGLWLRLSEVGRLSNLSDIVLNYRMSASKMSIEKHRKQRMASQQILSEVYSRRALGSPLNCRLTTRQVPRQASIITGQCRLCIVANGQLPESMPRPPWHKGRIVFTHVDLAKIVHSLTARPNRLISYARNRNASPKN